MVTPYDDRLDLNIVILDKDENILRWLDSDLCELKETSAVNKCRQIEVTYPLDLEDISLEGGSWYSAGNKIYIPPTLGISSCLYVINADYELDYWKENTVNFTAEEVLTELNYNLVGFITTVTPVSTGNEGEGENETPTPTPTEEDNISSGEMVELTYSDESQYRGSQIFKYKDKIELTSEVLTTFFGDFYDITGLDALDVEKKYISPSGTMTYMSLFRLIEEQTERVFVTEYLSNGNSIQRRLSLRNYQNMRRTAQTELLDLNYNLDSLELNVSEEDTYTAMAPEFTDNSTVVQADTSQAVLDTGSDLVNSAQNASSNTDTTETTTENNVSTTKSISEVIQTWLDYEVEPRQEHPMIIQKDTAGNLVEVATWYAPFRKMKGSLMITSDRATESNYTEINSYNNNHSFGKCGKVSTSETIPQIIYNTLANKLLNKLSPIYDLKIDVKDIQMLMGIPNLSYELYETLQVRIPNFDYYVPCRITGTTKNPHKPGENKITVETDVKSLRNLHETEIISSNMIINDNNLANIGGLLFSEEVGLPDRLVTINIKLLQAYTEETTVSTLMVQQAPSAFDPTNNTYIISHEEITENIRTYLARCTMDDDFNTKNPTYNVRCVTGEVVTVPRVDCWKIYYAHLENYELNRYFYGNVGTNNEDRWVHGSFDKTLTVHVYPRNTLNDTLNFQWVARNVKPAPKYYLEHYKKYTFSAFQYYVEDITTLYRNEGIIDSKTITVGPLNMAERQLGGYCTSAAFATIITAMLQFISSASVAKIIGATMDSGAQITSLTYNQQKLVDALEFEFGGGVTEGLQRTYILNGFSFDEDIFVDVVNDVAEMEYKYSMGWAYLIGVGVERLHTNEYYHGIYSLVQEGNHAICITNSKKVNGQRYVFVQDSNAPVFHPYYWPEYSPNDGWIRWDIIANAINSYYVEVNNTIFPLLARNGERGALLLSYGTDKLPIVNMASTGGVISVETPVQPIDLSNVTYIFHSSEIQRAIESVYKYYVEQGLKHDINTISQEVTSILGVHYNLKMKELMGIAYSYMYYYMNNQVESSNIDIRYGKDEDSMKYIEHMGTDYDYYTPVYPLQKRYEEMYIVCSALFHLGSMSSPLDFF